jgi:hypothetical protein
MSAYEKLLKNLQPKGDPEQYKSCQCGAVWFCDEGLIYGYETIIGVYTKGQVYLTTEKYSVTTTRQQNKMAKWLNSSAIYVTPKQLQAHVDTILAPFGMSLEDKADLT